MDRRITFPQALACGILGVLLYTTPMASHAAAPAAGWGTVKGQVVWADKAPPSRKTIVVTKDRAACLEKGPLLEEQYVVNPSSKGVRWVLVWLTEEKDGKKPLRPVHPDLNKVSKKIVEIDQPCCMFEPHLVAIQGGQSVAVKNSAGIAHNVKVDGGDLGPNVNPILPPGKLVTLKNIAARGLDLPIPIPISCSIHGWMKGYIAVLPTPYFAVTDKDGNFEIKNVPAGKCRMIMWQETAGWVLDGKSPKRKGGRVITVGANAPTDLGKIDLKPSKDE